MFSFAGLGFARLPYVS